MEMKKQYSGAEEVEDLQHGNGGLRNWIVRAIVPLTFTMLLAFGLATSVYGEKSALHVDATNNSGLNNRITLQTTPIKQVVNGPKETDLMNVRSKRNGEDSEQSSTSSEGSCAATQEQYQTCLDEKLSNKKADSCINCANASLMTSSFDSCGSFKTDFCSSFSSCEDCGECTTTIEKYVDCAIGGAGCFVNCGNAAPATDTSSTCDSAEAAYESCFETDLTSFEASFCAACVEALLAVSSTDSCDSFVADFCPELAACKCDACTPKVEEYVGCLIDDSGTSCSVDCISRGGASGGTSSGSSNSTTEQCGAEQQTYQTCLETDLRPKQARSCLGCVNNAVQVASSATTCNAFEQAFCPDFAMCRCGSCADELESYIACMAGNVCTLTCAGGGGSTGGGGAGGDSGSNGTVGSTSPYPNTRICRDYSGKEQPGYNICLDLNVENGDETIFKSASVSWSGKVVGDLPAVSSEGMDTRFACSAYPDTIDDLYICGNYQNIDGVGGILGQSSPVYTRFHSDLPVSGIMQFDSADVDSLKSEGTYEAVILHEMGHVLGFGSIWQTLHLIGTVKAGCPYRGKNANHEWQIISGCSTSVPIEQQGGDGTKCSHWDETCLQNELMTGYLGDTDPIFSNITIAAMEDIGYEVDYSKAQRFTSANLDPQCVCNRRLRADDAASSKIASVATQYRRLSPEGYKIAQEHGKRHLESMRTVRESLSSSDEVKFVGDQFVTVYYMEDGRIYHVHVTP